MLQNERLAIVRDNDGLEPVAQIADIRRTPRMFRTRVFALLTAWSAAAVAGPVIITELSNRAKAALPAGADRIHIYDTPLQVLAAY